MWSTGEVGVQPAGAAESPLVSADHTVPTAYPDHKSVGNMRAHRKMVINIERIGFIVLACIVTNDSRSKMSRFKRNMPAYESVLSDLKT